VMKKNKRSACCFLWLTTTTAITTAPKSLDALMIATLFALGPELFIPPILAFRMQPLCCSDRLQGTLQIAMHRGLLCGNNIRLY
jgi:hypothetical protein